MNPILKTTVRIALLAISLVSALEARAQAPSTAPAGSTGICKDGTWSTAASKDGACRGHKGVQTWYSATPAKPAAPARPAPAAAISGAAVPAPAAVMPGESVPAPAVAKSVPSTPATPRAATPAPKTNIAAERSKLLAGPPAPGGGPGLVWLNGSSKVYHCSTDEFYGKTKTGSYVTEADAKAKGAHASHNKACS